MKKILRGPCGGTIAVLAFTMCWGAVAAAASGGSFDSQFSNATMNAKSGKGAAYEKEFFQRLRPMVNGLENKCIVRSGDKRPKPIRAVVTINAEGGAQSVAVAPETPYAKCIAVELSSIKWPKPPTAPYLSAIDFD